MTRRQGGRGAESLRDAFSAANLRKVLGLTDTGRTLLARVEALRNETPVEHDGRDVLVRVVDVLAGLPLVARLHVPMNLLWRKPRAGETLAVVVPADANAPGGPVALYGDAGGSGAVPPWFDTKAGLYTAETVRVESSGANVELKADANITIQSGGGGRIDMQDGSQPFVRGNELADAVDTYVDALDVLADGMTTALGAVNTWAVAIVAQNPLNDPSGTLTTTLTTALTTTLTGVVGTFHGASTALKLARNNYLSTRIRGQ